MNIHPHPSSILIPWNLRPPELEPRTQHHAALRSPLRSPALQVRFGSTVALEHLATEKARRATWGFMYQQPTLQVSEMERPVATWQVLAGFGCW